MIINVKELKIIYYAKLSTEAINIYSNAINNEDFLLMKDSRFIYLLK